MKDGYCLEASVVADIRTQEEDRESSLHTEAGHHRSYACEVVGGIPLPDPRKILDRVEVALLPFVVAHLDDAIGRLEKRWWDRGGHRWVLRKDEFLGFPRFQSCVR